MEQSANIISLLRV